jgi:membrane protein DedA with SNARE-associated domain
MAIVLTPQVAAAAMLGLMIGMACGFVLGAWWHALRTELRVTVKPGQDSAP